MNEPPRHASRIGLWVTLVAAFVYCVWIGAHWLALDYSDKELAAFVSRVWDVQRELREHGRLPWWTPYYMSGSSYGLNHSQGFYLLPSLFFASFTDIHTAVKLTALLAIFAGALAMYGCARYFLSGSSAGVSPVPLGQGKRHGRDARAPEWAATLAGLAFLLHPEQLIRAAGAEHLGIIVFMPFMPLTFWLSARALDTGKFRDIFWCSLAAFGLLSTHNKMAFVFGIFLAGYLGYWFFRHRDWKQHARTLGLLAALTAGLSAILIVPGLIESKHVKLLSGEQEQLRQWQRGYAFKSLLALVDRDGIVTGATTREIGRLLHAQAFQPTTQAQADRMRESIQRLFSLGADSPEKYAGIVLLAVLAITILWNERRVNHGLFWFLIAALLLSIMLGYGSATVCGANWRTFWAVIDLPGVPAAMRASVFGSLAVTGALLAMFFRRKLTTTRKRLWAAGALAAFLFLPAFTILATVPFFKEIRAPYVFYDGPGTFFIALLAGFFVTDTKWHRPALVAAIAGLMLIDYWPYQRPTKDNGVPARTLGNLRSAYESVRADADRVKTYSISGRYFHLLGPMYSGKPQVYEAFYNWMSPVGTGLLNHTGLSRELLNLFGARYLVCDKTDPQANAQLFAQLRQMFPVHHEDEDFLVLRNDTARAYVTAYDRACAFTGDLRQSPQLAVALAANDWPLVHTDTPQAGRFATVYRAGEQPILPATRGQPVTLSDLKLSRPSNSEIRLGLTAPSACWLVIAESFYPFWRAQVDGRPAEVLRMNCALMGLELPAGSHQILLRYRPPRAYAVAGAISLLTLLGCVGALIWDARRARP
jgi:hypothetical protein